MTGKKHNSKITGFTIIELMIVVTILGVLASIAIPAFDEMIKNNRRTTVVNELVSSLTLARSEAVKRGQVVISCGFNDSNNNKTIDSGEVKCSGTGAEDWSDGWVTFVDVDTDGVLDSGEQPPTNQFVSNYSDIKITVGPMTTPSPPASGTKLIAMKPFNQGSSNGTVRICDSRGSSKARAIIISPNGRTRTSDKETDGSAITCS